MTDDWTFFRTHRHRTYRVRPASPRELAGLHEAGAFDGKTLAPGCGVFCNARMDRAAVSMQQNLQFLAEDDVDEEVDDDAARALQPRANIRYADVRGRLQ